MTEFSEFWGSHLKRESPTILKFLKRSSKAMSSTCSGSSCTVQWWLVDVEASKNNFLFRVEEMRGSTLNLDEFRSQNIRNSNLQKLLFRNKKIIPISISKGRTSRFKIGGKKFESFWESPYFEASTTSHHYTQLWSWQGVDHCMTLGHGSTAWA